MIAVAVRTDTATDHCLARRAQPPHRWLIDDGLTAGEKVAIGLSITAMVLEAAAADGHLLSGGLKTIPQFQAGAAGFGGSLTVTLSGCGEQAGNAAEVAVVTLKSLPTEADKGVALADVLARLPTATRNGIVLRDACEGVQAGFCACRF